MIPVSAQDRFRIRQYCVRDIGILLNVSHQEAEKIYQHFMNIHYRWLTPPDLCNLILQTIRTKNFDFDTIDSYNKFSPKRRV